MRLLETGEWPRVLELQDETVVQNVQASHHVAARTLPLRLGHVRADGRLLMTLEGLAERPEEDVLARDYLRTVDLVARRRAGRGLRGLSRRRVRRALGLSEPHAALIWRMLDLDPELFRRCRWWPGRVWVSDAVARYTQVDTSDPQARPVKEYLRVRRSFVQDDEATTERAEPRWTREFLLRTAIVVAGGITVAVVLAVTGMGPSHETTRTGVTVQTTAAP